MSVFERSDGGPLCVSRAPDQHLARPTPSHFAPPQREGGQMRVNSGTYATFRNQTNNKKGSPSGPPFSKPIHRSLTPESRPAPSSPHRWAPCRPRSSTRPWRRNRLRRGRLVQQPLRILACRQQEINQGFKSFKMKKKKKFLILCKI